MSSSSLSPNRKGQNLRVGGNGGDGGTCPPLLWVPNKCCTLGRKGTNCRPRPKDRDRDVLWTRTPPLSTRQWNSETFASSTPPWVWLMAWLTKVELENVRRGRTEWVDLTGLTNWKKKEEGREHVHFKWIRKEAIRSNWHRSFAG
jgi:hypothetical protein